jgi:glyoxylase-like metal-dependent hydrolase (beta-lactamase superfamily II)
MISNAHEDLGHQVWCVDSGLYRHGLAACYVIEQNGCLAFIDTGTTHTVPALLRLIADLGATPADVQYVMPTHVHLDHAGGTGDLMAACPNAQLVIHPKGAEHMIDPARLSAGATAVYGEEAFVRDFGHLTPVAAERVVMAQDGQSFDLGGRILTFLDSPGHANHHGCIWDQATQAFFTGDTFGIAYRELSTANGPFVFAPTTPVAFDPDAWLATLDKLMAYAPKAMYLTHYGRLDQPERHLQRLRNSIRGLAAIALAEEQAPDAERQQRLQRTVEQFFIDGLRAHGCTLPEQRIQQLLAIDSDLNAQGLEVWLVRRAKAARQAQPPTHG